METPKNGAPGPILSEAEVRAKRCAAEIDAVMAKYNCFMDVEVNLTRAGMKPIFKVIAKSEIILAPAGVLPNDQSKHLG